MQIEMAGVGRMGASLTRRLIRAGREHVVFDALPGAMRHGFAPAMKSLRTIDQSAYSADEARARRDASGAPQH